MKRYRTDRAGNAGMQHEAGGMSHVSRLTLSLVLVVACALGGAGLYLLYAGMTDFASARGVLATPGTAPPSPASAAFNPPRPEDAPQDIRDAVMLGYHIMIETKTYAGAYVGNALQCRSCHFDGGRDLNTLSLVGVAAKYPRYRSRSDYATDLVNRTQSCFERSMNGRPLPPEGKEMQAVMAYYHWISKGVPIYADIPWLGIKKLDSGHKPNAEAGGQVFAQVCARCHGGDGLGTRIAPPVWGPDSYNDGAGMHKLDNFSAFVHRYMPKDNPTLTVIEALDVAAYAGSRPRPHFSAGK